MLQIFLIYILLVSIVECSPGQFIVVINETNKWVYCILLSIIKHYTIVINETTLCLCELHWLVFNVGKLLSSFDGILI